MNKIRYWKKQLYLATVLYHSTSNSRTGVFQRAYNAVCEIGDYLFNLEERNWNPTLGDGIPTDARYTATR